MPSHTRFLRRKLFAFIPLALLLFALPLSATAWAQEKLATYPILPTGYSSIKVFDRDGRFVGRIMPTQRYWVPIERIPVFLRKALVAVEDSRFYDHNGIDVRGIARALVKDVVKRRMAEGGSTITQQLIKNKYLSGEKTFDRKLKEGMLAIDFEKKYTKDQILEMYFNTINFGNGTWGIAQAARFYFDKNPEELTDAECSLLAGVPKAPARYNPLGKPADVNTRRSVVLKRMEEVNFITPAQKQYIIQHPASVAKGQEAPSYLAHVRNKLIQQYGPQIIELGGLDVITAMDLPLQKLAEKTLTEGVRKNNPKLQGALICLDPATGDVLAAVGGVDATAGSYNRAFYAKRQPGSAIKPLIYAAALDTGLTPGTVMNDTPVAYPRGNGATWKPLNYERKLYGDLTLREALAHSNNVIAVKLLDGLGVPNFVTFASRMGLSLNSHPDLSLALGTTEVTLTELVSAYTPFANAGMRAEPRTIVRIYDRYRRSWSETPQSVTPALSPATAYVTTQMMKDVMIYGTAKGLKRFSAERPSAGKTGTTDDYRDAWFVGYTPQLITGVWVGYDKPKPGGRGFTGGGISAPIWGKFMRAALASKPAVDFPKPDNVVTVSIDPATGYLAAPDCPERREEYFIAGSEPTQYCPKHGGDKIPAVAPAAQPPATTAQPPAAEPPGLEAPAEPEGELPPGEVTAEPQETPEAQ